MAQPEDTLIAAYRRAYIMLLENMVSLRPTMFNEIRDILGGLLSLTRQWVQTNIPDYYTRGRERALNSPVTDGTVRQVDPRGNIPEGAHRASIEELAYNLYGDLTDSLEMVGRRIDGELRQAGLESTIAGRLAGETGRKTQRRLADNLKERGITGITDAAGREWRPDAYAGMAARTTLTEAQNLGTINQLADEGADLVRITEHASSCPICAKYEGRVYSISGSNARFPALRGTAFSVAYHTIHPNCRHRLTPYSEKYDPNADSTRRDSNKPFVDDRPEAEKRAYQEGQNRKRKARERKRRREEAQALDDNRDE